MSSLQVRIDNGETLESADSLTDEYRDLVSKMALFTANTELMGGFTEHKLIPEAPSLKRKLAHTAKVQDEIGHAQMQYRLVEELTGRDRDELLSMLLEGEVGFGNAFQYPIDDWMELTVFVWLIDGAAMILQHSLLKTNYGPYARVMQRICREEEFHIRHAEDMLREYATGSAAERDRLQDLVDAWWPRGVKFFGHPDGESRTVERMLELGIRPKSNDECRQDYLDFFVPRLRSYGLEVPDDDLAFDEEADEWTYTEPDWDEFRIATRGEGPVAGRRLEGRKRSFEETRWVREALEAYHQSTTRSRVTNEPAEGR